MDIEIKRIPDEQLKQKPRDESALGFGSIFTDYMFEMKYDQDKKWHDPVIRKYSALSFDPSTIVLHYAQTIFEGLKGYYRADGKTGLFRADKNFKRFNRSATRMCMPNIPEEDQKQALFELLKLERDWFPKAENTTIYIRPFMIGTMPRLGVHSSNTFSYFIILSPSGVYFSGHKQVSVYVPDDYIRAAPGGTGAAKTGGNYAATLIVGEAAKEKGCDQVLWLDAIERKYIEEVGAMNIFFVFGKTLVTSELGGTILEGVTRDSVIELARDLGYDVEERKISIDEVIEGVKTGSLTECFGAGTAAVISPVGKFLYKDTMYDITPEPGPVSQMLFKELTDIQWGRKEDKFGWTMVVEE